MLRVTQIIKPLYADAFDNIPDYILEEAQDYGIKGHKEIEDYIKGDLGIGNSKILYMFKESLEILPMHMESAQIEERIEKDFNMTSNKIKRIDFTEEFPAYIFKKLSGRPDYVDVESIRDWKFTAMGPRKETALQLTGYNILTGGTKACYAYQFNKAVTLSLYKLNDAVKEPLNELFWLLFKNHGAIEAGGLELYEALDVWEQLQSEFELFELIDIFYPPLVIDNQEKAMAICQTYKNLIALDKKRAYFKEQIKRWMNEEGITKIEFPGGTLNRQISKRPEYSSIPKEIKEQYRIGTKETISLVLRKTKE